METTFKFSQPSIDKLNTCHPDLIAIMTSVLSVTNMDFGIAEGHRNLERQKFLFDRGASKCDGITNKSKHNEYPSMACDVYVLLNGSITYTEHTLSYFAGMVWAITEYLYSKGAITHKIRWGGNWDSDQEILTDQNFMDLPHFELVKV